MSKILTLKMKLGEILAGCFCYAAIAVMILITTFSYFVTGPPVIVAFFWFSQRSDVSARFFPKRPALPYNIFLQRDCENNLQSMIVVLL